MSVPPTIAWLATLLVCVAYVGISLGVAGALSTLRPTESSNARAQAGLLIGRAFVGQSKAYRPARIARPVRQTSVTYKRAPKVLSKVAEQSPLYGRDDDEPA
jgi:hypothetical protein